jgi:hypothetical protein
LYEHVPLSGPRVLKAGLPRSLPGSVECVGGSGGWDQKGQKQITSRGRASTFVSVDRSDNSLTRCCPPVVCFHLQEGSCEVCPPRGTCAALVLRVQIWCTPGGTLGSANPPSGSRLGHNGIVSDLLKIWVPKTAFLCGNVCLWIATLDIAFGTSECGASKLEKQCAPIICSCFARFVPSGAKGCVKSRHPQVLRTNGARFSFLGEVSHTPLCPSPRPPPKQVN